VLKPGGAGMSKTAVLQAAGLALGRAPLVHSNLETALADLEQKYNAARMQRLEQLRALRLLEAKIAGKGAIVQTTDFGDGGIDIDDPILRYDFNHSAAPLGKSEVS
jgi:hypothetical protein